MFDFLFSKKSEEVVPKEVKVERLEGDLTPFFEHIEAVLGIGSLHERSIVRSKLKQIAQKFTLSSVDVFIQEFDKKDKLYREVVDAITVNETYFFRELESLKWVVNRVVNSSKEYKILSIPSSKGAEIYSLCILLFEAAPQKVWQQKFVGIDVDKESLEKAKKGLFSEHELHRLDSVYRAKYFTPQDGLYAINADIKECVSFYEDNIFELSQGKYGTFDIVMCRNLFIYFDDYYINEALKHLHQIVADDGYLLMGVADRMTEQSYFKKINNFIYQKQN